MKKFIKEQGLKAGAVIRRNGKTLVVVALTAFGAMCAQAQSTAPDATTIATNAQTAFNTIAPITIAIVGFYVILRLAKRTVK